MSVAQTSTSVSPTGASAGGLALNLDRLGKSFGETVILRDLSLSVPAGQFLSIVGRSGSGKSTLLRILCGLDRPTSGRVLAAGRPVEQGLARIMFQEPRLLPWARVLDNVMVGLPQEIPAHGGQARHAMRCGQWASKTGRRIGRPSCPEARSSVSHWPARS